MAVKNSYGSSIGITSAAKTQSVVGRLGKMNAHERAREPNCRPLNGAPLTTSSSFYNPTDRGEQERSPDGTGRVGFKC